MHISIRNLKKFYNKKLILDIDNLEIKRGRITGLLGPNGSGKTTLLNILAGMDEDYEGIVEYDKRTLSNGDRKNITMLFQKIQLFRRSVYENIEYPLKIRKIPKNKREKTITEIMQKTGISHLKHKKASHLSGGEIQKVALARSIVFVPKLLLLDEPTSNLDEKSIDTLEEQILNYNRETGKTVIYVTHNREHAKRICSEALYMEKGRIVKINGFL